ncbi:MAG TPA: Ni/Fe-hydrogenase cytochrome b subunit [Candidatus Polarisedimenticolaceae bacterium]|nr:Ni/Fe-hydrogenase cytochrome b subunit [Candidatus Polarisedimenticolaceae bacterium]
MTEHVAPAPLGGRLLTKPYAGLLGVLGLAFILIVWRFATGLGNTTALNDGYPWGIWIAFDVVTGTALATGGYAMAILVYIMNKGKYHPLVRPAVLTSALGYTMAGVSLVVDTGRPWNFWKVPLFWGQWNVDSVLLEVAVCIMSYVAVLWIELMPAICEKVEKDVKLPWLRGLAAKVGKFLDKALVFILALGVLLPTMHQSSLGSLMLVAGHKLDPIWLTPFLPLLFLISCIAMGYAIVVFESCLSASVFGRKGEEPMLRQLSRAMVPLILTFLALRFGDLLWRGQLGRIFSTRLAFFFWLEIALFVTALVLILKAPLKVDLGRLMRMGLLLMLAGALYRFDTFLVAFNPGNGWSYFPAVPELLITLGFVAAEFLIYLAAVKRFPILGGAHATAPRT